MMEDIKKYQYVQKLKKMREEVQTVPSYFDGLEPLHDRLHPGKLWLQVSDVKQLSGDTKLFRFVSARSTKVLAPFRAGQYIGLTVEINGVRTSRPYSIASSPNQLAYYELCVKKKGGGFVSPYLFENLKVGDIFEATEPMGNFYYNRIFHGKNLVFIAGGSGITPFISILRNISERALPFKVWLIFGCLTDKDILFKEELEDIQTRRPNIKVQYILSEPGPEWSGVSGFISKDKILKNIGSIDNKFYYIVGNQEMYRFVLNELKELEVPRHKIIYEAFGVPDDVTKIMGWPENIDALKKVRITLEFMQLRQKKKEVIEVPCVEPLLNSIERLMKLRIQVNNSCRSGQCGSCRTKLLSGKVFMPPEVKIREIDNDFGYIHPCISYPITDLHLDLTQI